MRRTCPTSASAPPGWTCQNPSGATDQSRPAACSVSGAVGGSDSGNATACPVDGATNPTRDPGGHVAPNRSSASSRGCSCGHRPATTTSWERWPRNPARPELLVPNVPRVRQPSPSARGSWAGVAVAVAVGSSTACTTNDSGRSIPANRVMASRTTAAFSRRCAAGSTCCQSHPPHSRATAQGGSRRSGLATSTSTTSARTNLALRPMDVTRTRTVSPGRPCRTNRTCPSCRATQCPPCATAPTSTSTRSPTATPSPSGTMVQPPSPRPRTPRPSPRRARRGAGRRVPGPRAPRRSARWTAAATAR